MNINRVTITGADDKTDINKLSVLAYKYPFVEWGILFSGTKEGTPRYPSNGWILDVESMDLPLSAHFCGQYSREILEKQNFELLQSTIGKYKRVQLNYNFGVSKKHFVRSLIVNTSQEIILQYNKSNSQTIDSLSSVFPTNFQILFDSSGGRGRELKFNDIAEPEWDLYTGYSGGLCVDNISLVCSDITSLPAKRNVWIDLESGARTNNEFDIAKVQEILELVSPYINVNTAQ